MVLFYTCPTHLVSSLYVFAMAFVLITPILILLEFGRYFNRISFQYFVAGTDGLSSVKFSKFTIAFLTFSAAAAAAAALKQELTLPEISQTLIATRTTMHASGMPEGEDLETLGKSGATLAIHLSIRNLKHIEDTLTPLYGEDCPVIVAYRVGWPDEEFIHGTLSNIREKMKKSKISRTALILVGRVFGEQTFRDSALYHPDHVHVLRPKTKKVSVG